MVTPEVLPRSGYFSNESPQLCVNDIYTAYLSQGESHYSLVNGHSTWRVLLLRHGGNDDQPDNVIS